MTTPKDFVCEPCEDVDCRCGCQSGAGIRISEPTVLRTGYVCEYCYDDVFEKAVIVGPEHHDILYVHMLARTLGEDLGDHLCLADESDNDVDCHCGCRAISLVNWFVGGIAVLDGLRALDLRPEMVQVFQVE